MASASSLVYEVASKPAFQTKKGGGYCVTSEQKVAYMAAFFMYRF